MSHIHSNPPELSFISPTSNIPSSPFTRQPYRLPIYYSTTLSTPSYEHSHFKVLKTYPGEYQQQYLPARQYLPTQQLLPTRQQLPNQEQSEVYFLAHEYKLKLYSVVKQFYLKLLKQQYYFYLREWKQNYEIKQLQEQVQCTKAHETKLFEEKQNSENRLVMVQEYLKRNNYRKYGYFNKMVDQLSGRRCAHCGDGEVIKHLKSMLDTVEQHHYGCLVERKIMLGKYYQAQARVIVLEDEYDKVYAVSKDQEKLLRELRNQLEAERRVGKEVEEGREERSQMVNRCCGEDRVRESIADKRCGNCEKRCCERRCCEREFIYQENNSKLNSRCSQRRPTYQYHIYNQQQSQPSSRRQTAAPFIKYNYAANSLSTKSSHLLLPRQSSRSILADRLNLDHTLPDSSLLIQKHYRPTASLPKFANTFAQPHSTLLSLSLGQSNTGDESIESAYRTSESRQHPYGQQSGQHIQQSGQYVQQSYGQPRKQVRDIWKDVTDPIVATATTVPLQHTATTMRNYLAKTVYQNRRI